MKIAIIGAGDQTANMVDLFNVGYAFIFDTPREPGETKYGLPVLDYIPDISGEIYWISSVGETRHKRELIERVLKIRPVSFTNLTHPTTTIARSSKRGRGVYMQPFSSLYAYTEVGDHVLLCGACNVGHHSKIGDYCTLGHQVFLGGHVTVEDGVFLGSGCKVRPGQTIGEGAVIGMGAVVTKDVPPNEIWIGNPARPQLDKEWPYFESGVFYEDDRPKKMMEPWDDVFRWMNKIDDVVKGGPPK